MPQRKPARRNPLDRSVIDPVYFTDQLAKSQFFHLKLHEWKLILIANALEELKGEDFNWNLEELSISKKAWDKVTHRAIKPIMVFANPEVFEAVPGSLGYYRMLSLVSQKSMIQIKLPVLRYEIEGIVPDPETGLLIAQRLNHVINHLIEFDDELDDREFILWRGMAAGSTAQGSWQNKKGAAIESVVRDLLRQRIEVSGLVLSKVQDEVELELDKPLEEQPEIDQKRFFLADGRIVAFASDPDIAIYKDNVIQLSVEIKGGVDKAAALERLGASLKSHHRIKEQNPEAITIVILQGAALTPSYRKELEANNKSIDRWFTVGEILDAGEKQYELFKLFKI